MGYLNPPYLPAYLCRLGPSPTLENWQTLFLSISTYFTDGSRLATVNSHYYGIYSQDPREIVEYMGDTATIAGLWQAHQTKLAELNATKTPWPLDPDAFIIALEKQSKLSLERLAKTKEIVWVKPGETYRMSWWTALQALIKVALKKQQTAPQSQPTSPETPPENPADPASTDAMINLEVAEFHRRQQQQAGMSNLIKGGILIGSLLIFIVSYSFIFEPYRLVIFVSTLFLHESGHVLAMKLFGYRDTTMLFLPFFGALATARKDNATLTEKVWVSLAGPLPGLILGIGLAIALNSQAPSADLGQTASWRTEFGWVREASLMLILLNLFNLLPVYPLDGGQVVNLLLFSPNPYLGVLFKGIGVLLLGLLGLRQPMLLLFALLIAMGIPHSFQVAKLSASLRKDLGAIPPSDRESLVRRILTRLQNPPYQKLPFAQKYTLVVGLLESHQESTAPWPVRVGLSGLYFISLLAGMVGGIYAIVPQEVWPGNSAALQQQMLRQEVAQANRVLSQNPHDVQAYLRRGHARLGLEDAPGAIADADQALRLNPNSPKGYQLRSMARKRLGDPQGAEADKEQARTLILTEQIQQSERALAKNPKDIKAYLDRANAKMGLKDYPGAIADCNQVLQFSPKQISALLQRGQIYLAQKDYPKALADANQILKIKPKSSDAYELRSQIRRAMGDEPGAIADEKKADLLYQAEDTVEETPRP